MNKTTHPYFIPNGENRRETATLLVGTADEYGIDQRDIRMIRGGFRISQAVADALGLDTSDEAEPDTEPDTEPVLTGQVPVSGNDDLTVGVDPEATPADGDDDDDAPALPYGEWDYADLKAEVAERNLATEDKKTETLIAALEADDNNTSGNRAGENEE